MTAHHSALNCNRIHSLSHAVHLLGQIGQHWPFVVVGSTSVSMHIVGKHHTSGQKVLAFPPDEPVAPTGPFSTEMSGFTQYGQQWPSTETGAKPPGQTRSFAHSIFAHGSVIGSLAPIWMAESALFSLIF